MSSHSESGSLTSPFVNNQADGASNERAIKHRSSKACQACRKRKVRCDVTANGPCCTNCRLDRLECVLVASKRGRNKHNRHLNTTSARQSSQPMAARLATPSSMSNSGQTDQDRRRSIETVAVPVPACVTFEEESDEQPAGNLAGDQVVTEQTSASAYSEHLSPETAIHNFTYHLSPSTELTIPDFIVPLSGRVSNDDLAFLARKGALTVPKPDLQREILAAYLCSCQPFNPMLDYRPFVNAIFGGEEQHRISLLLFQAVMFAGLHSLPLTVIYRLGFESTKEARQVFFTRVRYLYDFEVEPDDAAVFQSLVLMSSWYGKWDERRHTWHFTGLAYDLARTMGLHREPTGINLSEKDRHFRRRLWWSLYIRDRLLALGTRRPMRIQDDEHDVAMLTLEDFDLEPVKEPHGLATRLPGADENTSMALMCIELAKLCISIGNVVSSRYTTLSDEPDIPRTVMMVSRRHEGHDAELQRCEAELCAWFEEVNSNIRRSTPSNPLDTQGSYAEIHWSMLRLDYYTAVNVLHRAQALKPPPHDAEARSVHQSSKAKVKDAARNITKLSVSMLCNDQVRYLGVMGVTALVAACLSHMLDVSSANEDVRDASRFRLHQSLQVLGTLRGIWRSADAADTFIASVARKAGVDVLPWATADQAATTNKPVGKIARPSAISQGSSASKGAAATSRTGWPLMSNEGGTVSTGGQTRSIPMPAQSVGRQRQSYALLDAQYPDTRHGLGTPDTISTATLSASDRVFISAGRADSGLLGDGITQSISAMFGRPPGLADDVSLFNWSNEISDSMAVEPMSFNFDFYSNALDFPNGHL